MFTDECLTRQHRCIVQHIRQSPLPLPTKHLLLQLLTKCLEHPASATTLCVSPGEIVAEFGLAEWANRLKTARAALQQKIQQAEDAGLLCLEPIPYSKCTNFLRWTPERAVRPPRQRHFPLHQSDKAACALASLDVAELPLQHWKGRPSRRVWRQLRQAVLARDERTCAYCSTRSGRMTCDHIIPVSRGGSSSLDNLVTACLACNSAKAAKTPDEWEQTRKRQSLKEAH